MPTNKLYKADILNIRKIFPEKFIDCPQLGNLSHSRSLSPGLTIHSSLKFLDQSWLAEPPADVTGSQGDWFSLKDDFPSHRFGNTVMPKAAREVHGDPPFQFVFKYEDARTQNFFAGTPWLKGGKIKLPSCFESGSTFGGHIVQKLALAEGLDRKALQTAHGMFDFNKDFDLILDNLVASDFAGDGWKGVVSKFKILLNLNLKALRKTLLYTSSSVIVSKQMAREHILSRFVGKKQLKEACLYSDFGTPDLFGPLCADMAANVKMYRSHDTKEWLLTPRSFSAGKRKSASVSPSPYKKVSSSLSSVVAAPVAASGPKKQVGAGVFRDAKRKFGKRGRRGRGGKGS